MPKISVIIPVYNTERYLRDCMDSIINQTLKDIEIICTNDGSSDSSLQILKEYEKKDSRIIVIDKENTGAGDSRNKGLEVASGEYIHFMDSDDILLEDSYQNLWNGILENDYPNIARFKGIAFSDEHNYIKIRAYEQTNTNFSKLKISVDNDLKAIFHLIVPVWGGIINRKFLLKTGIRFPNFKVCNDRAFFIETILLAKYVYLLDLFVLKHRIDNKDSLIGIRARHFSCMFDSFNRIKKFCYDNHISTKQTKQILIQELNDIFSFYKQYKNNDNFFDIYQQLVMFLKTLEQNDLLPEIKAKRYYPEFNKLYNLRISDIKESYLKMQKQNKLHNILQPIFSIKKSKDQKYKIITILGLKIKLERK